MTKILASYKFAIILLFVMVYPSSSFIDRYFKNKTRGFLKQDVICIKVAKEASSTCRQIKKIRLKMAAPSENVSAKSEKSKEYLLKLRQQVREMCQTIMGDGFEWEYISADNFFEALKLIENYFLKEEYAALATKIADNPVAVKEYFLYCAYIASDGVSTIIRDAKTKEVVACSFNKFVTPPDEKTGEHFFETFGKKFLTQPESKNLVIDFSAITERTNIFEKFGIECSMEEVIWSVHPDYRNKKLSFALIMYCMDTILMMDNNPVPKFHVETLGPHYSALTNLPTTTVKPEGIHAICTSPITQSLALKYGGIKVDEVFFTEIMYNGKSYEELLEEKGQSAVLMLFLRREW